MEKITDEELSEILIEFAIWQYETGAVKVDKMLLPTMVRAYLKNGRELIETLKDK